MKDTILAELAALRGAPALALKAQWRVLFETEPPPYNRRFLENRLAYRLQELAYGGLKKETVEQLRVLAKQYDGKPGGRSKKRPARLPISGTRLIRSATKLARELIAEDARNKYDKLIDKGILYKMLNNPVYIGVAMHKGISYPGEHVGIIDRKVWEKVQARFQENPRKRAAATRAQTPSLLKGIIYDATGTAMSPTHTRKRGRLYRYYVSQTVLKQGSAECPVARVPAAEIEKLVVEQVRLLLLSPEIIVQTWRSARKSVKGMTESEVRDALRAFDPLWNQFFPAEQSRIIQLLVERVDVLIDRVDIKLRIAGITSLIGELSGNSTIQRDAA
jgi:site-specific DNA recombinase